MAPRDGKRKPPRRRELASCEHCLAWGLTYCQGLCLDCYNFIAARHQHLPGICGACRRLAPLKRGYCRLCWCQARLNRSTSATDARLAVVLAPYLPTVRHHQLFLAGHSARTAKPRTIERRRGTKGRPLKQPPPPAARPAAAWSQPHLFEVTGRDYRAHRIDLRTGPPPDNPWLAWALHLAHQMTELRGWIPQHRRAMQHVLVTLLAHHTHGEKIKASDARQVALRRFISLDFVLEILAAMGLLDEDLPSTFDTWLKAKITPLTPAFADTATAWITSLRRGGPRQHPRDPATAATYLTALLPALTDWSTRYSHPREVTADDVRGFHDPLHGHQRTTALSALRSLFAWAKREKLIFKDPTRHLAGHKPALRLWQPIGPDEIAAAVQAAHTPQAQLFLALSAVHGARPGQIRALRLTDVDLAGGRLTIAGVHRPLDDLTRTVLVHWLDHRHDRWPRTANPHLLVSKESALGLGPVSHVYVTDLRRAGLTFEQLRIDRRLEEALATGGDPALFLAVFGGSQATAIRYAANARSLLQPPHETAPTAPHRTPGPKLDNQPDLP